MLPAVLALSLAGAAAGTPLSTPEHKPVAHRLTIAPLVPAVHPHGSLNDSYIVVFKDSAAPHLVSNHFRFLQSAHGVADVDTGLTHVYDGHLRGYAGKFSADALDAIRAQPEVDYVEQDQVVRTMETQNSAPWGLARVSHRKKLTFGTFRRYEYDTQGGAGVDVYVIDTGININHEEFEGRASWGATIPKNDVDEDANGHGTHCAGTIASRRYGVAKAANVIAVKVLGSNGSGSMSDVVSGVLFAVKAADKKAKESQAEFARTGKTSHKGSVANMSLGGGSSKALDATVNKAVDNGLHFAVAAGNDNQDACKYSPAAAEKAVTVGASSLSDERAYFSNFGTCVDVFAPGLNILSTWIGSKSASNTISGTSMASPHTAGMLAYLLSIYPSKAFDPALEPDLAGDRALAGAYRAAYGVLPAWASRFLPSPALVLETAAVAPKTLTPYELKKALIALSTPNVLANVGTGSPNVLIFNNATA